MNKNRRGTREGVILSRVRKSSGMFLENPRDGWMTQGEFAIEISLWPPISFCSPPAMFATRASGYIDQGRSPVPCLRDPAVQLEDNRLGIGHPAGRLLSVSVGDLPDKLGPSHVHGPVDLAGFRSRVILENFHHQGRVVRDDDARL